MSEPIAAFIAAITEHIAHEPGWSQAEATVWVQRHVAEARAEYRAASSLLGDTDKGFVAWLLPRHRPPTA
jgi:hypothetical protein